MRDMLVFAVAVIWTAVVSVWYYTPTKPPACIQEVYQGRTVSRELGTFAHDPQTGLPVCSRRTY